MSYHIITIDEPLAALTCAHKQLICKTKEGVRQVPLDDVCAIVVCSFEATIDSTLLLEASARGIGLVICRNYLPECLVLPAQRSTDTLLTRAWQQVPSERLREAWERTLDAKCANQIALAAAWDRGSPVIGRMAEAAKGRYPAREATVSRLYWQVFRMRIGEPSFLRKREGGGANPFLNYGYAVLLARVLQACFACGLDPTFGIGHVTAERSTPLAYDLMEPFRPLVDLKVGKWLDEGGAMDSRTVDLPFRRHIAPFLQERIRYQGESVTVMNAIERVVRSFRKMLLTAQPEEYVPWEEMSSRWDG